MKTQTVRDVREETVTISGELNQPKIISNSISSDEYLDFATRKIIILKRTAKYTSCYM
jgi:hypothetical protein